MRRGKVIVRWPSGLHLRTATELVRLTQRFTSRVGLKVGSKFADARSVLSVLLLSAGLGTALDIEASGVDEHEAIQALEEFFGNLEDDGPTRGGGQPD